MTFDFEKGEILLVDKPYEWTSFDVVRKLKHAIRYASGKDKFKIGHAGTLDPLATGLLVVCLGKATKKIEEIQAGIKEYTGTFCLGATTPSFDLETEINEHFAIDHLSEEALKTAAQKMTGKQQQIPPVFSAKSIDGKRLYQLARKKRAVEIKPVQVEISKFEISNFQNLHTSCLADFIIECGKGTYIRSIASDFGKKLNTGAYLHSLRRTKNGIFSIEQAKPLSQWIKEISGEEMDLTGSKRKFHRDRKGIQ